MTIKINIVLNDDNDDFKMLKILKKKESQELYLKIFKIGYDILFPPIEKIKQNIEYFELYQNIENLKSDFKKSNLTSKIDELETSLNKLIGISSNSYKKGEFAENLLEDLVKTRYGDIVYEKKNNTNHSGDAWLYLPNDKIIMLESKNYTSTINKEEINKLESDMKTHNIKYGILISFNSSIQGMKELDIHTFINNNNNHYIIMISNLTNNISKLDLGIQIIRKIINTFNDNNNITWIEKDILKNLNELNFLIQKNYILRDNFYIMEREINKLLSTYHTNLRNYQFDIDNKINQIIKNINLSLDNSNDIYNDILKKYNNYKTFNIISKIIDICINKKWFINSQENDYIIYNIKNSYNNIILKIQNKKIILNILSNSIQLYFDTDNTNQHLINFELLNLVVL
jgi:hypothetical protein